MWRALTTCPRSASPPGSRLLSWSGRRALGKTTLATASAKALGIASAVISAPTASEAAAYLQGSNRQYQQSAPGVGVRALRAAKISRLLLMIDYIDKGSGRSA